MADTASPYVITVQIDPPFAGRVNTQQLGGAIERTLAAEGVHSGTLTVVITDDATVRDLNARFLGIDETTDVLSFPLRPTETDEAFIMPEEAGEELGDIVISLPAAERQAADQGLPLGNEVAHLAVHGALHLLGYDHIEPEEDQRMRAKEEALLAELGIMVRHERARHQA